MDHSSTRWSLSPLNWLSTMMFNRPSSTISSFHRNPHVLMNQHSASKIRCRPSCSCSERQRASLLFVGSSSPLDSNPARGLASRPPPSFLSPALFIINRARGEIVSITAILFVRLMDRNFQTLPLFHRTLIMGAQGPINPTIYWGPPKFLFLAPRINV